MSYAETRSRLAERRRRVLVVCLVVLILACSRDDAPGDRPGTFRVLKAVARGFLANSVEASKELEEGPLEGLATQLPQAPPLGPLVAEPPETCFVPYNGPVTIIPVRTPAALQRSIDDRRGVSIVYETDDTAIWEDGRVLTMDVENLGTHLNAVGWASNPMRILGASARPGGSVANLGWNSGQTSFKKKAGARKRKRRRG